MMLSTSSKRKPTQQFSSFLNFLLLTSCCLSIDGFQSVIVPSARSKASKTTTLSVTPTVFSTIRCDDDEPDKKPPPVRRQPPLPTVDGSNGKQLDVVSRLLKDRILLLGTDVNDEVANVLVAQLLFLANEDPDKDITLYINSPGGSVSAGLAIYDTMQFIPCDIQTVCFGMAASMGAFLLGAGAKGKRKSLPNARIMIHQPLGGAQGQAADIEIQAKEILFTKASLNKYMADYTDQPIEKIAEDTDRDFFMTPYEAKDYGIIDEVIKTKTSHIPLPAMPSLKM